MNVFDLRSNERLEIGKLIRRLDHPSRIDWLTWCCQQVSVGEKQLFLTGRVLGTERETWEYWEYLCVQHDLDVRQSRAELEQRVRQTGRPLLISTMPRPFRRLWLGGMSDASR